MDSTYEYETRQYMPRRTKKLIRAMFWLMLLVFAVGVGLLIKDGNFDKSFDDWQNAGQKVQAKFQQVQAKLAESSDAQKEGE
ncbi:MAG: hypothetical protein CMF62_11250 [Magnetococcales bacterium]|nr:hypothetical protein [Magnetococcales bacterium]|tara:strand:- start:30990 stop:31235 length:246 start_codon:yes stop_codon:yes gene_type:complete